MVFDNARRLNSRERKRISDALDAEYIDCGISSCPIDTGSRWAIKSRFEATIPPSYSPTTSRKELMVAEALAVAESISRSGCSRWETSLDHGGQSSIPLTVPTRRKAVYEESSTSCEESDSSNDQRQEQHRRRHKNHLRSMSKVHMVHASEIPSSLRALPYRTGPW